METRLETGTNGRRKSGFAHGEGAGEGEKLVGHRGHFC